MSRLSLACALSLLCSSLVGCEEQTAIELVFNSSSLAIPADLDSLEIYASGEGMRSIQTEVPLTERWPQTFVLRPGEQDDLGEIEIRVTAKKNGENQVRRVVRSRFEEGTIVEVNVSFARDCLGVFCSDPSVECNAGRCGEPMDAGMDMRMDMNAPDMDLDMEIDMPDDMPDMSLDMDEDADLDMGDDADMPLDAPMDMVEDAEDMAPDLPVDMGPTGPGGLIISEYVEGSSNNKALELTNLSEETVDLSLCELHLHRSGATSSDTIPLTGSMAPTTSFVICHTSFSEPALCDLDVGASLNHNGDDAYLLSCSGTPIDRVGDTLGDPGVRWGTPELGTENCTLRRRCEFNTGDPDIATPFTPATEWQGFPSNTFDGLGTHCTGSE